jgi:hypothetical protein
MFDESHHLVVEYSRWADESVATLSRFWHAASFECCYDIKFGDGIDAPAVSTTFFDRSNSHRAHFLTAWKEQEQSIQFRCVCDLLSTPRCSSPTQVLRPNKAIRYRYLIAWILTLVYNEASFETTADSIAKLGGQLRPTADTV